MRARGDAALNLWLEQRDELLAGRKPRAKGDLLTVKVLIDSFLTAKEQLVQSRDIVQRTFDTYHEIGMYVADAFGRSTAVIDLRPADFDSLRTSLSKRFGPSAMRLWVSQVRSMFRYAYEADLLDRPIKLGPHFKAPGKKAVRELRAAKGERLFTPQELRTLINKAPVILKAMILLGINCGFGNHDCAALTFKSLDLDGGWINFPRPKTGIMRRSPLWKETIDAIRTVIARRKEPVDKSHENLVFIGQRGLPYVTDHYTRALGDKFTRFSKKIGVYREGMSFYALRHAFETIAGDSRDQVATDALMGHVDSSMAGVYRERIEDARLVAVTNHVHAWLFGKGGAA